MRDFKSMKRQRSRGRGGGSGGGGGGSGGKPGHNVNRAFDSNGPDGVKIRGAAQHVFEKYQQLARDAASSGDRVLAENYMQHAEHYFRVLRAVQPQRPVTEIMGRDAFTSGIDIDFEDESGAYAQEESSEQGDDGGETRDTRGDQRPEQRSDQQRPDNGRGDYRQDRQDRRPDYRRDEPRSDSRQENRPEGRQEAPRDDRGYRDDRGPRNEGQRNEGQRNEAQRNESRRDERGPRDDRPSRYESRGERGPESGGDPLPVVEPQATPLTGHRSEEAASPTLRAHDGGFSPAPAFLQARAETAAPEAEAAPAKRRGRPPKVRTEEAQPAEASEES